MLLKLCQDIRNSGTFIIGMLLVSGCSVQALSPTLAKKSLSDEAICQQIEGIFEKSEDGFNTIREQPSYHNKATLWKSSYQLIPDSCEIWQWSDKYSYVCNRVMPDKESAEMVYQKAAQTISQCIRNLSSYWQEQPVSWEGQREQRYSFNSDLRGSLKLVDTGGVFQDTWTVYFRIDSPNMMR